MKISLILIFCSALFLISCGTTEDNLRFDVRFYVEPNQNIEKGLLKVVFTNDEDQGIVIFNAISFRKMFGPNQRAYLNDRDQPLFGDTLKVPYSYLGEKQVPSLDSEMTLHLKAKELVEHSNWVGLEQFPYLKDRTLSPFLIFVGAHAHKELYYKIKPETKGKYMFSYLQIDKSTRDRSQIRGAMRMDSIIDGKVENYRFVYKGIKVDSLEVDFP